MIWIILGACALVFALLAWHDIEAGKLDGSDGA